MKKALMASLILFLVGNSTMAQSSAAKSQTASKVQKKQAEEKKAAATSQPKKTGNESPQDSKKRADFDAKSKELVDPRAISQKK